MVVLACCCTLKGALELGCKSVVVEIGRSVVGLFGGVA